MFIRWKRRLTASKKSYKQYNEVKTDEVLGTYANGSPRYKWVRIPKTDEEKTLRLSAYLCTSERVNGEPRQKAVYLSSINFQYINQVGHQSPFWSRALAKLDGLTIPAEQRQSLESAIMRRVPRPTDEAIAKSDAEFQAYMQALTNNLSKLRGRV